MTEKTAGIEDTIADVMSRVAAEIASKGVGKSGTNREQNYKYRPVDDVLNVVGPIMAKHGLGLSAVYTDRQAERVPTQKGGVKTIVTLRGIFTYKWKSEESVTETYGEAMDSSDKATNKAMSMALKYAHIATFNIPVVGADDADLSSPETRLNDPNGKDDVAGRMSESELNAWTGQLFASESDEELRAVLKDAFAKAREYGDAKAHAALKAAAESRHTQLSGATKQ